ncbi:hypothetical protein J437_LFUL007795 [Ladona fulva]|uniref:Uncharacterized protein n=1 Tax=Ladona fulva TaxID=123851 RepID=A0A8K0JTH0_LADFU|nr:hypothetical protein J437_LFUL007795 [Ladona fulva]
MKNKIYRRTHTTQMDSFSFLCEINSLSQVFELRVQARGPSKQDNRGKDKRIVRRKRTKEMRLQGPNSLGTKEVAYDGERQVIGSEEWPANAEDRVRLQTTEATPQVRNYAIRS